MEVRYDGRQLYIGTEIPVLEYFHQGRFQIRRARRRISRWQGVRRRL